MKKISLLILTVLLVFSCQKEERTDYVINGVAKGVYNGIRMYLNTYDSRGKITTIDTAIVMDEKFIFKGKLINPGLYFVSGNSINGRLPLFIENNDITIELNKSNLYQSKISGSLSHEIYNNYVKDIRAKQQDLSSLNNKLQQARISNDSSKFKI